MPPLNGHRLRVAAAQYFIRPVRTFDAFAEQVESVVETAADYKCRVVVLPEYTSMQLASLADDIGRPIDELVRFVTGYRDQVVELLQDLARAHGIYVLGGTIPVAEGDVVYNDAYLVAPSGDVGVQGKLHATRFEKEGWLVSARNQLKVFETDFGRVAIAVCYDVEFPELVRAAAFEGVHLLLVPSCTDDRLGFLRVRYCAHARAIENQLYVVHSPTVGGLPRVTDMSMNYGSAAIITPSDFAFARDGILAEGIHGQETVVVGELDMDAIEQSRTFGTVLPLNDSRHTAALARDIETVIL